MSGEFAGELDATERAALAEWRRRSSPTGLSVEYARFLHYLERYDAVSGERELPPHRQDEYVAPYPLPVPTGGARLHENRARILGMMLGGAMGDAIGRSVAATSFEETQERLAAGSDTSTLQISENTQLTLFTAEGLIRAHTRLRHSGEDDAVGAIHHAFQRWLHTQGVPWDDARTTDTPNTPDGWLVTERRLFARRSATTTVMAACHQASALEHLGQRKEPVNEARDAGALTHAAPLALFWEKRVGEQPSWREAGTRHADLVARVASLTHGHPDGYLPAVVMALTARNLFAGEPRLRAFATTIGHIRKRMGSENTVRTLGATAELMRATEHRDPTRQELEDVADPRLAPGVLAVALCSANVRSRSFESAMRMATDHSGDIVATATVTGQLMGLEHGPAIVPASWWQALELRDVVERMALDLCAEFGPQAPDTPDWIDRYPIP
ncbi:ADP-ribosylglycohydrolase [Streptoalloteichus tenebrarius]|uniref:ADP-ribosylglycohydrolase n=1 Tax=Streptoalloteichus tenebrarius (strain ATCC 17920 / DSM 40477 / JCM 4838 / CBS 697.72 / NBRC 16177 / NCIMB 11028 / NRRL B-12390 / A12253. 1 / ISP 5477) TaxID=1933 RepID=A0ABT1HZ73_STRSD|nr:ADP-ribosylglycohydrolase family protein [Streptoalloteichus tenebrarius]MCP2260837.1 ADP-ribosylglycohydrolase [Streptoalloteichus tenebrarius]BFF00489.1 hypothetical protein GCM10020241_21640 [Streptoalloteichus tenebrarius]